jgi:hypothetical protein
LGEHGFFPDFRFETRLIQNPSREKFPPHADTDPVAEYRELTQRQHDAEQTV